MDKIVAVIFLCLGFVFVVAAQYTYYNEFETFRNWSQAAAFCKSSSRGGLAKMAGVALFNQLLPELKANGTFWIDGTDKETVDRFEVVKDCTQNDLDFTGIADANLKFPAASCLALTKDAEPAKSKIKAHPCSYVFKGVICGIPTVGCTP